MHCSDGVRVMVGFGTGGTRFLIVSYKPLSISWVAWHRATVNKVPPSLAVVVRMMEYLKIIIFTHVQGE